MSKENPDVLGTMDQLQKNKSIWEAELESNFYDYFCSKPESNAEVIFRVATIVNLILEDPTVRFATQLRSENQYYKNNPHALEACKSLPDFVSKVLLDKGRFIDVQSGQGRKDRSYLLTLPREVLGDALTEVFDFQQEKNLLDDESDIVLTKGNTKIKLIDMGGRDFGIEVEVDGSTEDSIYMEGLETYKEKYTDPERYLYIVQTLALDDLSSSFNNSNSKDPAKRSRLIHWGKESETGLICSAAAEYPMTNDAANLLGLQKGVRSFEARGYFDTYQEFVQIFDPTSELYKKIINSEIVKEGDINGLHEDLGKILESYRGYDPDDKITFQFDFSDCDSVIVDKEERFAITASRIPDSEDKVDVNIVYSPRFAEEQLLPDLKEADANLEKAQKEYDTLAYRLTQIRLGEL